MDPLSALVFATPVFGLSLTPPAIDGAYALQPPALVATVGMLQVEGATPDAEDAAPAPPAEAAGAPAPPPNDTAAQMQRRASLTRLHRPLGIATWAAMLGTVVLGYIQYHNLYGFFDSRDGNPCARGDAVFGQASCSNTPWPHLTAAMATTALYSATFAISLMMPDPLDLSSGDSDYARNLRRHKILRWIHFGGMISQLLFGFMAANHERFGLNRADDYGALRTIATFHQISGWLTFGALTYAGAIMVF